MVGDIFKNNNFGSSVLYALEDLFNKRFKIVRIFSVLFDFCMVLASIIGYQFLPFYVKFYSSIQYIRYFIIMVFTTLILLEIEHARKVYSDILDVYYYLEDCKFKHKEASLFDTFYIVKERNTLHMSHFVQVCSLTLFGTVLQNNFHLQTGYVVLINVFIIAFFMILSSKVYKINEDKLLENSIMKVLENKDGNYLHLCDCTAILCKNTLGYIGKDGKLMYRLHRDMSYFKMRTNGLIVIMGRKTYESIGRPLDNRYNIVITSSKEPLHNLSDQPIYQVDSLEKALAVAYRICITKFKRPHNSIFIIGGATVYKEAFPFTHTIYSTIVQDERDGDTKIEIPAEFIHKYPDTFIEDSGFNTYRQMYERK